MPEMNQKHELPTPESADLEPLARALVALRREEAPLAPSAELRRAVEARLDEIESDSQGKTITKEQVMLKDKGTGSRFRLRDWVFFAGGSVAAAVATAIIFWPPPRTDVAVRKEPSPRTAHSALAELDKDMAMAGSHFQGDVTLYNGQESAVISSSPSSNTGPQTAAKFTTSQKAMTKFASDKEAMSSAAGAGAASADVGYLAGGPGMGGSPGMPGMAGGMGGGGMPGMGARGGPAGVGGMMPGGMPGALGGGPGMG